MRAWKRAAKVGIGTAFTGVLVILLCNWWVVYSTKSQIYFDLNKLPANDVGLVLGTSKYVKNGNENLFFRYRMEATARLWKEGKVKFLILSGNNDSEFYNEPEDMQKALLKLGVPSDVMIPDYAGYRTFDSILRCKEVFKQHHITIISQNFHNARALYIGNYEGINGVAFAAQDVPDGYSLKTLVREYMARPLAMLDVHFLRPQPETGNKRL
ncbi:SanA/YdcF family protein [Fibrivirga algicola]|uniref:SanA protein n=1 Tax=Fibrivirga algicola TaxID=2950420 RepID=A0ABX0QEL5_9BACT|nr:ElyC/SanA/YdcF family protein [Fibrivirga algicola]ARK13746.1 SanA protein [Fibrella sp. ES10-3-2-2]NID10871.1 SanA protein [Fibrivirga algicola]